MDESARETVLRILHRTPQWIRHDLGAKDSQARAQAEEILATMITSALHDIAELPVRTSPGANPDQAR
jgi:hypothetical protein